MTDAIATRPTSAIDRSESIAKLAGAAWQSAQGAYTPATAATINVLQAEVRHAVVRHAWTRAVQPLSDDTACL